MKKIVRNKIIKYIKLIFIISFIILTAFSQIYETKSARHVSNQLSLRDEGILITYISGIILIPLIVYCISKLKKQKY